MPPFPPPPRLPSYMYPSSRVYIFLRVAYASLLGYTLHPRCSSGVVETEEGDRGQGGAPDSEDGLSNLFHGAEFGLYCI